MLMARAAFFAIARELREYTVGVSYDFSSNLIAQMARKDVKTKKDESSDAFYEINQEVSSLCHCS